MIAFQVLAEQCGFPMMQFKLLAQVMTVLLLLIVFFH